MEGVLAFTVVLAVWVACGFSIARENERVVKIFLGRPYKTAGSGVFWIPFGLAWVRRYPTKVVELTFARRDDEWKVLKDDRGRPLPAGGFITARGTIGEGTDARKVGPVNLGVSLSFRFNWPRDQRHLFRCVELLPDPRDLHGLTDIFQEVIMDETRSVGCQMTYIGIMVDRAGFAGQITKSVTQGQSSQLLVETGLQPSARVVIDHIDIPKEALEAIDNEESARLAAEGVRRKAEGEKDRLKLEGEGRADAIRAISAAGPDAIELEGQRTLREMAQGPATTVFIPMDGLRQLVKGLIGNKGK